MSELITPIGIITFPTFFTPKPRTPGGDPVYSCALVFDAAAQRTAEFKALRTAIFEAALDKWGGPSRDQNNLPRNMRTPILSERTNPDYYGKYQGFDAGSVFIRPWSKFQPGMVDASNQDILIEGDVWAGQLWRLSVAPFAYDTSGNRGVGLMLNNAQQAKRDMPRMDGRKSANATFAPMAEVEGAGGDAGTATTNVDDFFGG